MCFCSTLNWLKSSINSCKVMTTALLETGSQHGAQWRSKRQHCGAGLLRCLPGRSTRHPYYCCVCRTLVAWSFLRRCHCWLPWRWLLSARQADFQPTCDEGSCAVTHDDMTQHNSMHVNQPTDIMFVTLGAFWDTRRGHCPVGSAACDGHQLHCYQHGHQCKVSFKHCFSATASNTHPQTSISAICISAVEEVHTQAQQRIGPWYRHMIVSGGICEMEPLNRNTPSPGSRAPHIFRDHEKGASSGVGAGTPPALPLHFGSGIREVECRA